MSALVHWLLVACPFVFAGVVALRRGTEPSRPLVAGAAASTLALSGAALVSAIAARWSSDPSAGAAGAARSAFLVEGPALVLVPTFAAIALASVIAVPRRLVHRRSAVVMLVSLGAVVGASSATDLITLVGFFVVGALAPAFATRAGEGHPQVRARLAVSAAVGVLALLAAIVVAGLAAGTDVLSAPVELAAIDVGLSPTTATWVLALLAVAAASRMAVYPFHTSMTSLLESAPLLVPVAVAGDVGVVLFIRLALPLLHHASPSALPVLATLALLAALRSAISGLGQKRAGGLVAAVASSHLASMFAAFTTRTNESLTGALVEVVAVGLATTGLLTVLAAVEARVGVADLRTHGRLGRAMPRAALAWFFFTFALVGFPGTLSFVAEDLMIHGLLHLHPLASAVFIACSALNALALFRGGSALFLGPGPERRTTEDLLLRERLVVATLILITLASGLAPGGLVSISDDVTISLARDVPRPGDVATD